MAKKTISDEDKALFREMMRGVKPLGSHPQQKKNTSSPASNNLLKHPSPATAKQLLPLPCPSETIYLSDYVSEPVQAESLLVYCPAHFPKKRFLALKKGEILPQGTLDLHGFNTVQAKEIFINFIQQQSSINHRCVLIIHGKGSYGQEPPILKNLVNQWLKQHPAVLAFHSAVPQQGGTGAVYVLLKRHSPEI